MRTLLKGVLKFFLIILIVATLIYNYRTNVLTTETAVVLQKAGIKILDPDAYLKTHPLYFDCSKPYWRDWAPGIIKCDINESEIRAVKPIAEKVKGKNILETAWNLHRWLESNTKYDYEKYVTLEEGTLLPHEFLEKRKGVCRDYAVFNYAVMKALGYREIYIGHITMSGSIYGHEVLVFKYNGTYYALDWWGPQKINGEYAKIWGSDLSILILNDRGEIVDYIGVTRFWFLNELPTITINAVGLLLIIAIAKA